MTTRLITEEQFESGSAIDGSRIQKALDETEGYFNNIPLEAISERYSLNYMVFTSLGCNVGYLNGAASPVMSQSGWFKYPPFLPAGEAKRVKGLYREEGFDAGSAGAAAINQPEAKPAYIFTVSTMFDRPVIIDSVCLFMMNKLPDASIRIPWWSTVAAPGGTLIDRYKSDQKYTVLDPAGRSIQRTRVLIETDDTVSSEDRTLNSKEFVLQDFQEKFWAPEKWSAPAASAVMFPETSESPSGKFMENASDEGIYLLKENINIPIHQRARVRFRVVSYGGDAINKIEDAKDVKPENMTLTIVYKEALISG